MHVNPQPHQLNPQTLWCSYGMGYGAESCLLMHPRTPPQAEGLGHGPWGEEPSLQKLQ